MLLKSHFSKSEGPVLCRARGALRHRSGLLPIPAGGSCMSAELLALEGMSSPCHLWNPHRPPRDRSFSSHRCEHGGLAGVKRFAQGHTAQACGRYAVPGVRAAGLLPLHGCVSLGICPVAHRRHSVHSAASALGLVFPAGC